MPHHTLYTAEIVLPMGGASPIRDGGVVMDEEGRIVEVGEIGAIVSRYDARRDHQILLPGVLNCHVHLTDARRSEPLPGGAGLNPWVRELLSVRNVEGEVDGEESLHDAVARVLGRMQDAGTVAVGEVANNLATLEPIAASGMRCRFIHELIGFREERAGAIMDRALEEKESAHWPDHVRHTFGAHAPYSVSPELMRLIQERTAGDGLFFHQHLAEDPAERVLYECADGPWRDYLEQLGAWDKKWSPQGAHPVAFYEDRGLLNDRFVAVHLADATTEEVKVLAARGVRAILSPSSNLHITGKFPPVEAIVASGMRFALGTDGRGSNASIDVFSEAARLLERWTDLRPGIVLEALTSVGAEILQFEELGSLRAGARPGLLSVETDDVGDDLRSVERAIVLSPASKRTLLP